MDYVYGYDEIVSDFVAQMIPACQQRGFKNCKTIGIISDVSLVAGLVYHNYNPDAGVIEISSAAIPGSRWMTRETVKRMYQYPFLQLGCQMVYMHTSERNDRVLRILSALGHTFVRVPRMLGRDEDSVICTLTREAWQQNKMCRRFKHHLEQMPLSEAA